MLLEAGFYIKTMYKCAVVLRTVFLLKIRRKIDLLAQYLEVIVAEVP